MLEGLPDWMLTVWPWMVWGGGAAIIVNEIVFRNIKRYRGYKNPTKHMEDG